MKRRVRVGDRRPPQDEPTAACRGVRRRRLVGGGLSECGKCIVASTLDVRSLLDSPSLPFLNQFSRELAMDSAWQSIVSSCAIQTSSREIGPPSESAFAVRERWLRRCERCATRLPRAAAARTPRRRTISPLNSPPLCGSYVRPPLTAISAPRGTTSQKWGTGMLCAMATRRTSSWSTHPSRGTRSTPSATTSPKSREWGARRRGGASSASSSRLLRVRAVVAGFPPHQPRATMSRAAASGGTHSRSVTQ